MRTASLGQKLGGYSPHLFSRSAPSRSKPPDTHPALRARLETSPAITNAWSHITASSAYAPQRRDPGQPGLLLGPRIGYPRSRTETYSSRGAPCESHFLTLSDFFSRRSSSLAARPPASSASRTPRPLRKPGCRSTHPPLGKLNLAANKEPAAGPAVHARSGHPAPRAPVAANVSRRDDVAELTPATPLGSRPVLSGSAKIFGARVIYARRSVAAKTAADTKGFPAASPPDRAAAARPTLAEVANGKCDAWAQPRASNAEARRHDRRSGDPTSRELVRD